MSAPADPEFRVRRMARADLDLIRQWADAEGWNPGLHDAGAFHAADPDGFFLGERDGEPVGCVSCVRYGDRYGFLGQYIVRPGFRGRGYGLRIWQEGMRHLAGRTVGLDGVLAQQANYERSGFRLAHHHVRYQGAGGGVPAAGVTDVSAVPFADLALYDARMFGADRSAFLRAWVGLTGATALGVVSGGRLVGYGVIRPSSGGFKIGPLFAADRKVADAVFRSLLARVPGAAVCVDVPEAAANPDAAELVARHGWAEVFRTARMYAGEPPAVPVREVYGVTSLELG
ncbi:MAG: GNAT family N-acetyltransferase [Gemmataceae bacterium]